MDTDESKKEDYSEAMNDPAFLQVSTKITLLKDLQRVKLSRYSKPRSLDKCMICEGHLFSSTTSCSLLPQMDWDTLSPQQMSRLGSASSGFG